MSDGPHRSLNMRPWWKQVAMRADKRAFDVTECADAVTVAMERECTEELRPSFLRGLRNAHEEPGLFSPAESLHLHRLVPETPLERCVLDNIAVLSQAELSDVNGLLNAVTNAIASVVPRYNRQIEEHYLRVSGPDHALRERERLDEAGARADLPGVALRLLRSGGVRTVPVLRKKTELADGVSR